jgi:predicted ester cyclase
MKKSPLLVLVFSLALVCMTLSCKRQVAEGITKEQAKAFMDYIPKLWNDSNFVLVDKWFSQDFIMHTPMSPEPIIGTKAFKEGLSTERKAFSEVNVKINDVFIKGDKIAATWTSTRTHSGPLVLPWGEIPPAGKKIKSSGVSVCRMVKGKIVEFWLYDNPMEILIPLGFTLSPPQPPKHEVTK